MDFGLILSWVWNGFSNGVWVDFNKLFLCWFWVIFGLVLLILCLEYQMLKWVLLIVVVDRWGWFCVCSSMMRGMSFRRENWASCKGRAERWDEGCEASGIERTDEFYGYFRNSSSANGNSSNAKCAFWFMDLLRSISFARLGCVFCLGAKHN